jgi:HNH endonuclease
VSDRYISESIKNRVRESAHNRCGYCQSLQKYVLGILEIEHIMPSAAGGSDDENNLWLSCRLCNSYKGAQTNAVDPVSNKSVQLFNPRTQKWSEHLSWSEDGVRISGLTPCGRATVIALRLNNVYAVTVRQAWVSVGWHPPLEDE